MASERPTPPPIVVLDANLLCPFQLRNLLVQFGVDGVIAPRWTAHIHEEWIGNLVAAGRAPLDRLRRTRELMDRALPDADIQGWKQHMDGLVLPDPDDLHVLAAALAAGAGTILTMNLRDFPASAIAAHGVRAVHPDGFLCDLHADDRELVQASVEAAYANLSRTTPSFADYLDALGAPRPAGVDARSAGLRPLWRIRPCDAGMRCARTCPARWNGLAPRDIAIVAQ